MVFRDGEVIKRLELRGVVVGVRDRHRHRCGSGAPHGVAEVVREDNEGQPVLSFAIESRLQPDFACDLRRKRGRGERERERARRFPNRKKAVRKLARAFNLNFAAKRAN